MGAEKETEKKKKKKKKGKSLLFKVVASVVVESWREDEWKEKKREKKNWQSIEACAFYSDPGALC